MLAWESIQRRMEDFRGGLTRARVKATQQRLEIFRSASGDLPISGGRSSTWSPARASEAGLAFVKHVLYLAYSPGRVNRVTRIAQRKSGGSRHNALDRRPPVYFTKNLWPLS